MARSRNIKPGFFTNDKLAELPALTRLLFIGLWTIADRDGRVEDRPKKIKAECLPYDSIDADDALNELASAGFLERYTVEGVAVIQVVNWSKHQNPHMKEQASTLPEMTMPDASMVLAPYKQQPTTEVAGLIPDSGFPSSEAKASGAEAPPKTRDELWAAGKSLLVSQGMPKAQCGTFVGKLVKDYGDEVVVDAVRSAVVQRPADAASYLKATCQSLAGERVGTAKERADAERVNEAASAQIDTTQAYLAKLDAHKPSPPPASLRKVHG